jgi:hypothetical protein
MSNGTFDFAVALRGERAKALGVDGKVSVDVVRLTCELDDAEPASVWPS